MWIIRYLAPTRRCKDRCACYSPVMNQTILQLKVTLIDTDPPVWRRILVPAEYSFADLHNVLQDAMWWTDSHLHQFFTARPFGRSAAYKRISLPMPDIDLPGEENALDERKEKLLKWLGKPKDIVFYEYDFGDSWMHEVMLEKIVPAESVDRYPQLVDGANACPPEDCGGPGGYMRLREVLSNPDDDEHDEMLEWLGIGEPEEFDPTRFDPKQVVFRSAKRRK
jgi:hypothetical protein